ncbi:MAG TPA: neutral/alkaline non-lysosomal ceramidase N-terminal domain-containing protein [Myxococcales bacterium]|jgi:neutral ceramidase
MRKSARLSLACVLSLAACELTPGAPRAAEDLGDLARRKDAVGGACAANQTFLVGTGVFDITGPAAEVGMMGYAQTGQKTAGIQTRLRSRAFVLGTPCNGKRIVFVSADQLAVFQGVKQQVIERLQAAYGSTYGDANVILSGTHTHSGPGGVSHYALYNLTVLGYDAQGFEAVVDGIYQSIVRAHDSAVEGRIKIARGDLLDTTVNRSPTAYLANPAAERAQYAYDTDKRMTLLRLERADGTELGVINWFAIHATSMGNDNKLISGDNKGYASYLFEKAKGTDYAAASTFVAAFAQSNAGDASPNIYGGETGEGANDFESTQISGNKQYAKALELYTGASEYLIGAVDYRHTFVKMDGVTVGAAYTGGSPAPTCTSAIGLSMIAGAEDGPGYGSEGATCQDVSNLWSAFTCATTTTSCQAEKPIVLSTGDKTPFPWVPEVLPMQVATVGNLAVVATPFEITTMSGRRLRNTVASGLALMGITDVVVAAPSNAYAGYTATREEYALQHYEGASTQFGPWQLAAIQQEVDSLSEALASGTASPAGPTPRDLRNEQTTLQTGVLFDDKPLLKSFGSVYSNAAASYTRGQTASVTFWGAHPKNNLRTQGSFLQVQRKVGTSWTTVAQDWDWETKYSWARNSCVPTFACSHVTIQWAIPQTAAPGTYRIRHDGDWKSGWDGLIRPYTGTSREFTVY